MYNLYIMIDQTIDLFVYTDGACKNNGRANAKAGIGIYFGENDPRNLSKKIVGKQTNNVAELTAVLETYPLIQEDLKEKKVCIVTDSNYVIKCLGSYGEKCYKNNWKNKNKPIPNVDLLKQTYLLYKDSGVIFQHIEAHTGKQDPHSLGNEMADLLANKAVGITNTSKKIEKKIYLNVKYEEKDEAKLLGAKWDPKKKKWYSFTNNTKLDELLLRYPQ